VRVGQEATHEQGADAVGHGRYDVKRLAGQADREGVGVDDLDIAP
jgi:hypothetical protein